MKLWTTTQRAPMTRSLATSCSQLPRSRESKRGSRSRRRRPAAACTEPSRCTRCVLASRQRGGQRVTPCVESRDRAAPSHEPTASCVASGLTIRGDAAFWRPSGPGNKLNCGNRSRRFRGKQDRLVGWQGPACSRHNSTRVAWDQQTGDYG